jgi:hypothetical protein
VRSNREIDEETIAFDANRPRFVRLTAPAEKSAFAPAVHLSTRRESARVL